MKILRLMYMILATIALLPIIALVSVTYLAWIIYICVKAEEPLKTAYEIWRNLLRKGVEMNLDFIENGL